MKTPSRSRFVSLLPVAILGGLLATLVAAMFVPALSARPELAVMALSGLILYSFGALAMVSQPRPRVVKSRAGRMVLAEAIVTPPARVITARARRPRHDTERLAA